MLKLADIKKDAVLVGIIPNQAVKVVSVDPVGEGAVTVYYRDPQGKLAERMLFRADEPTLDLQQAGPQQPGHDHGLPEYGSSGQISSRSSARDPSLLC